MQIFQHVLLCFLFAFILFILDATGEEAKVFRELKYFSIFKIEYHIEPETCLYVSVDLGYIHM